MVLKPLETQKKRQKILLISALGIFLIAIVILYFGFWQEGGPIIETGAPAEEIIPDYMRSAVSEKKLERINLEFGFLIEKMLPFLKSHGDLPVEKGQTGRDNPFLPYWLEQVE